MVAIRRTQRGEGVVTDLFILRPALTGVWRHANDTFGPQRTGRTSAHRRRERHLTKGHLATCAAPTSSTPPKRLCYVLRWTIYTRNLYILR